MRVTDIVKIVSLVTALVAVTFVSPAGGVEPDVDGSIEGSQYGASRCQNYDDAADGTLRQRFPAVDETGQIAGFPPRVETQISRGESGQICVGFQNRTGQPITLDLTLEDVGADDDGIPAVGIEDAEFGASSWLELPTTVVNDLPHGEVAWVLLDADVPRDAVTGSSYASVVATARTPDRSDGDEGGARVNSIPSVGVQIFFDVAGNADHTGEIVDARAPRVVWWDGPDLGRIPVLDKLRGLGVATVRYSWRNDGNLSSRVDGTVSLTSDLGGRKVAQLDPSGGVVLRGAERQFEATWNQDIPFFGRFTPVLEVQGSGGVTDRVELDPIWVIPSWWYLLALVLAIALPLWWRRRSKRRYADLLARVEAAEARGADGDSDDEWDERDDRWS